ncbi:hypothetical protein RB195_000838 [Necator americanus]|uniref:Reverse transcriptase domain-containing protein n=1 Tax=Necator americanus TaxID=51031 RepID=A0ABR1DC90_NECAM
MRLRFLGFEAAFDSPLRGFLNALRADEVPVRTSAVCTTPFETVTEVRQGAVAGSFLFNSAIKDIMRGTVNQCRADIILAPSGRALTDFEHADDVVIFEKSGKEL